MNVFYIITSIEVWHLITRETYQKRIFYASMRFMKNILSLPSWIINLNFIFTFILMYLKKCRHSDSFIWQWKSFAFSIRHTRTQVMLSANNLNKPRLGYFCSLQIILMVLIHFIILMKYGAYFFESSKYMHLLWTCILQKIKNV